MISLGKPANYVISRFQKARRKAGNNDLKLLFHGRIRFRQGRVGD